MGPGVLSFTRDGEYAVGAISNAGIPNRTPPGEQDACLEEILAIGAGGGLGYGPTLVRMWRNWQTRTAQDRMGAIPWRFKSSHPHQTCPLT